MKCKTKERRGRASLRCWQPSLCCSLAVVVVFVVFQQTVCALSLGTASVTVTFLALNHFGLCLPFPSRLPLLQHTTFSLLSLHPRKQLFSQEEPDSFLEKLSGLFFSLSLFLFCRCCCSGLIVCVCVRAHGVYVYVCLRCSRYSLSGHVFRFGSVRCEAEDLSFGLPKPEKRSRVFWTLFSTHAVKCWALLVLCLRDFFAFLSLLFFLLFLFGVFTCMTIHGPPLPR